jgi:hypothetical protein
MIQKVIFIFVLMMSILFLYGSPSSIDLEGMQEKMDVKSMSASIKSLMMAENNYLQMSRRDLPIDDWRSALRKTRNRVSYIPGVNITYGETAGTGRYFCLTSDSGAHNRIVRVFQSVSERVVDNDGYQGYINDTCGATSTETDTSTLNEISFTIYTGN